MFIGQIELTDIWLIQAHVANRHGPHTPVEAAVSFESEATWHTWERGFCVEHAWRVHFDSPDVRLAEVEVTFGLRFSSQQAMTDRVFAVFREVNLPVNTWPYLREFVATTLGRMGCQPFALPALKQGTEPARRAAQSRSAEPARPHRRQARSRG